MSAIEPEFGGLAPVNDSEDSLQSRSRNLGSMDSKHASRLAREDFESKRSKNYIKVDRWMSWLLLVESIAIVSFAFASAFSQPLNQPALFTTATIAAIAAGLIGTLAVVALTFRSHCFGRLPTRMVIAASQAFLAATLVQLLADRVDTFAPIFASLAILAFYRDVRVLIPSFAITVLNFVLGQLNWMNGISADALPGNLITIERGFWMVIEIGGLCIAIRENLKRWHRDSILQTQLQYERDHLESSIAIRTNELMSLKRFREEVLNSIDASICILDMHGKIVFVNKKWTLFAEENGVSNSCTVGSVYVEKCGITNWGPPEFVAAVAASINATLVGESDSFCCEYSFKVGSDQRHYRLSVTPVPLERQLGVAIVHVDITHLKRAELRALALAKLLRESPDEVLIADCKTHQLIEVNDRAVKNTEFPRSELLNMQVFCLFPPAFLPEFDQALNLVGNEEDQVVRLNSTIRRKDGSEYPCSVSVLRNNFEGTDVWVLYVSDLTELKKLETKLQQAQKLESLGTLAAGIAHELNTPIQFVSNNTKFLKDSFESINRVLGLYANLLEVCKGSDEYGSRAEVVQQACDQVDLRFLLDEIPQAIDQTLDGTTSVSRIVKAMKGFSHPGTDNFQEIDINSIVESTLVITRSEWKYCAELETQFSPDLPAVRCLPGELNQVFLNIIVNAAHAMQDVKSKNPDTKGTLRVRTGAENDNVFIEIQDTGAGIPEAIQGRVFDPFFTTKGVGKGTGQGLAISYAIVVDLHNGAISFTSVEGEGTTFRIELPIARTCPKLQPT